MRIDRVRQIIPAENQKFKAAIVAQFEGTLREGVHPTTEIGMKDFFISYNKADKQWAEWIAWQLEEAGYSLIIQEWDFRPGGNFVIEMQQALVGTKKMIAVLSESYLNAEFTQPEWAAVFAKDPQSLQKNLLLAKVGKCELQGLLTPLIYVSLLNVDEPTAREKLLGALKDRGKPDQAPFFPGSIPIKPVVSELRTIKADPLFPSSITDKHVPDSIDNITLASEQGVDYGRLRDLLKAGEWKEADQETLKVIMKYAKRESQRWADAESLKKLPCLDLRTIDQLWVIASNGHFGISVQTKIWGECGNPTAYTDTWKLFCDRLGWYKEENPLKFSDLKFSLSHSQKGELPSWVWSDENAGDLIGGEVFFARAKVCGL